jgi:hypothetical protein
MSRLNNWSLNVYLAFFGFIVLIIGLVLCWASAGVTQQSSFDSSSALSGSSVELLVGCFVALIGAVFLLLGLLSSTRKRHPLYYY